MLLNWWLEWGIKSGRTYEEERVKNSYSCSAGCFVVMMTSNMLTWLYEERAEWFVGEEGGQCLRRNPKCISLLQCY